MSTIDVIVIILFTVAVGCALGFLRNYETIVDEVQVLLPDSQKLRFPRASWNTFKVLNLHRQFYPVSRLRAGSRFLIATAITAMFSIALIILAIAFSKPPAPPR